jgi:hypothetical protein
VIAVMLPQSIAECLLTFFAVGLNPNLLGIIKWRFWGVVDRLHGLWLMVELLMFNNV